VKVLAHSRQGWPEISRLGEGEIVFDGKPFRVDSPMAAQAGGISTIYQEINLVGYRSVTENIFLGREHRRFGLLDWGRMQREAREILERFCVRIDVRQPLSIYTTAVQQMVAIARAVSVKAKLVIMDEPTSSLDDQEVRVLFDVIRQLKSSGVSVVFVSHKLEELYAICDSVTVMRDGRTVLVGNIAELSRLDLVTTMIGRALEVVDGEQTAFGVVRRPNGSIEKPPLLQVKNLASGRKVIDASLDLAPGEIVGLSGLLGSGRTEVARAVFGADQPDAGEMIYRSEPYNPGSPAKAIAAGVGFCSEDRKMDGIVPDMSVRENVTLALLPRLARAGIVDSERQRGVVEDFIRQLGIKCSSADQPIRELSGGNQQKVILARWLCLSPRLLLLDEPTRGIDVGAKREIQTLIARLAAEGLGVLMISSEIEEIVEGSNRVFVLREGRTVAALKGPKISEETIMAAMADGTAAIHQGDDRMSRKRDAAPSVDGVDRKVASAQTASTLSPLAAIAPAPEKAKRRPPSWLRRYGTGFALLVLLLFNLIFTPHFLSWQTLNVNLTQVCTIVIVAVGMTLVIATGGIDLSVGSLMAISGALAPIIFLDKWVHLPFGFNVVLSFLAPVAVVSLLGWFNGWLITRFRIQPIVATLVLFIAGRGIAQVLTNGNLQAFTLPSFQWIGLGRVLGLPFQAVLMVVLVAGAAWLLNRTVFGRQVLAIGGNEEAARLSGVPVISVKRLVYLSSGFCAGIAGLIVIAINSSSDANLVGLGMELDAIAAVAVGGTRLSGGYASVVGTLLGAFIIQLVRYTLLANGVPDAAALVVKGAIIVASVWIQQRTKPS
jgi:monosaccharide-transporting ATPase